MVHADCIYHTLVSNYMCAVDHTISKWLKIVCGNTPIRNVVEGHVVVFVLRYGYLDSRQWRPGQAVDDDAPYPLLAAQLIGGKHFEATFGVSVGTEKECVEQIFSAGSGNVYFVFYRVDRIAQVHWF